MFNNFLNNVFNNFIKIVLIEIKKTKFYKIINLICVLEGRRTLYIGYVL